MPGYFIYCRKSSEAEDRQVLSIESQISELKQLAAKLNLPILEVFTESNSAKEPGRPIFNMMMQRVYKSEAAGIICWKLDRLARNAVDGGSIIWSVKQHGIKVITPSQTFAREDDNIILMYIEFGMAQKYVDDLSKNVKRGVRTKIQNGWYHGIAPLGYLNHTDRKTGQNTIIEDPERFALIRRMWDAMLQGTHSPAKIAEIANQKWGFRTRVMPKLGCKPLSRSGIYRIFTQPFYFGKFEFPKGSGAWYAGKHKPMITQDEYDRVQIMLGRDGNPRQKSKLDFMFRGLIRCGDCGRAVSAEEKHQVICCKCKLKFAYKKRDSCPRCEIPIKKMDTPVFLHYTYYQCSKSGNPNCRQKCVTQEQLENEIANKLSSITISDKFRDYCVRYLHKIHAHELATRKAVTQSQQREYRTCLQQIENLVTLKTSPENLDGSQLTNEEYSARREKLLKQKAILEEQFRDGGDQFDKRLVLSEKAFDFACSAKEGFINGDINTKKMIVTTLCSNLILKDKKLIIEAVKPLFLLEEALNSNPAEETQSEPNLTKEISGPCLPFVSHGPTLRGRWDDVRTLKHQGESVSATIYHFFQSACMSPSFNVADWFSLYHSGSINDQEKKS